MVAKSDAGRGPASSPRGESDADRKARYCAALESIAGRRVHLVMSAATVGVVISGLQLSLHRLSGPDRERNERTVRSMIESLVEAIADVSSDPASIREYFNRKAKEA